MEFWQYVGLTAGFKIESMLLGLGTRTHVHRQNYLEVHRDFVAV